MTRAEVLGLAIRDTTLEAEVRGRLAEVEAALEKAVRSDSDFVTEAASYLVSAGGKRFRPMLLLLAGYFGDPSDPRLTQGAVAIEIVHLATLYHDDVIDEAEARRGHVSVNATWGNTVAILTGDFLFARASEISAELGTDVSKLLARTIATGGGAERQGHGRRERVHGDHPAEDRRPDRHVLPPGGDVVGCSGRRRRAPRGPGLGSRDGLPAVRRHHGRRLQRGGASQGAGPGHAGGRVHAPRAVCPAGRGDGGRARLAARRRAAAGRAADAGTRHRPRRRIAGPGTPGRHAARPSGPIAGR